MLRVLSVMNPKCNASWFCGLTQHFVLFFFSCCFEAEVSPKVFFLPQSMSLVVCFFPTVLLKNSTFIMVFFNSNLGIKHFSFFSCFTLEVLVSNIGILIYLLFTKSHHHPQRMYTHTSVRTRILVLPPAVYRSCTSGSML